MRPGRITPEAAAAVAVAALVVAAAALREARNGRIIGAPWVSAGDPAHVPDGLMSAIEVARAFGVDRGTVYQWAKSGRFPCVRTPTGMRRYRREDIDAWIERETGIPGPNLAA
jgi:excisionase family DNA binding protein